MNKTNMGPKLDRLSHTGAWRLCAVAGVVASLALAGCAAIGPDYQRPEVPLPAAYRNLLPDTADLVNTAWWEAFGDPELNALVRSTLDHNRDLRQAVYRIEEFEAKLQISKAADKPQVGYGFNGARTKRSLEQPDQFSLSANPEFNAFTLGVNISWELDLWGRVKRQNEAAMAEWLAAEANQRALMLSLVTATATSYVQLLALDREMVVARDTLKNRQDLLSLVVARQKGGSALQVQVENARADVQAVEAMLPDIERRTANTENALSVLAGRFPGPVQRRSLDRLTLPKVPAGVPSDVLFRRPDVLAAEQALIAANARIGVAKSEYLPTVSLTAALGLASDQLRWLLAQTARAGEITRGLAGTLFSAGRIEGEVRAAEVLRKQTTEAYLKAVQLGLQEIDDALVFRVKAGEQGQALDRQLKTLEEVVRLSKLRYGGGQTTYLDVLDAERQVVQAQGLSAQSRRDEFLSLVTVFKAMGGGWMVEQNKLRVANQPAVAALAAASASAPQNTFEIEAP